MARLNRRTLMASCAALATTGALASLGSTVADENDSSSFAAGYPDGWSSDGGNPANGRYLPLEGEFSKPESVVWRYDETGSVAVVDGTVYVQTGAELHALDAADGELRWETEVDADGRPAVIDGTVCVGGEDRITALDAADGSVRWEREFDGEDGLPSPTVAFETVYVVADGTLYALDVGDGSTRWTREAIDAEPDLPEASDPDADGSPSASFRPVTVAVANGTVYAALEAPEDGYDEGFDPTQAFGAVDAETGEARWEVAFQSAQLGPVEGPIIATADEIFATAPGPSGFTFDAETGDVGGYDMQVAAATAGAHFHVGHDMYRNVNAIDHEDGRRWSVGSVPYSMGHVTVAGDTVLVDHTHDAQAEEPPYPADSILAFDRRDGSERWILEFDESAGVRAIDENTLYTVLADQVDDLLELSVSAPDSIAVDECATIEISVTNTVNEAISTTVSLETDLVTESAEIELEAGESASAAYEIRGTDLCPGPYDWTVTAGGQGESGTLTVTDE